ncbi:MAG: transcriptional regulator, family [Pseudomonas sp.]|nr:transcriptional regulator, family [Pseudomonas sp.]
MQSYFPLECRETLQNIGLRVKQQRLDMQMRQSDLAQSIGVSSPTIGKIEAGERGVELGTFMLVLWRLGLLSQIIGEVKAPPKLATESQRVRLRKPKKDDF